VAGYSARAVAVASRNFPAWLSAKASRFSPGGQESNQPVSQ